jgi:hypothetical protein
MISGNNKVCFSFDSGGQVFVVRWIILNFLDLCYALDNKTNPGCSLNNFINLSWRAAVQFPQFGI